MRAGPVSYLRVSAAVLAALSGWSIAAGVSACTRAAGDGAVVGPEPHLDAALLVANERADAAPGLATAPTAAPAPTAPPKPGMAWIPPGVLLAGTPPDRAPRIAEEEPPGTAISMHGFYIDLLPFPNEPGAISTINVTREDAAHLCEGKGKRLCSEHEWERACKGPANTTYEYGDAYRANACGTGAAITQSARRPVGERAACKSGFGVLDMHGGAWEWTDSAWMRGSYAARSLYVLRGGNAEAGELAGRCANALARRPTVKSPTMGFRCCSGDKSDDEPPFEFKKGLVIERSAKPADHAGMLVAYGTKTWGSDGAGAFVPSIAWTWRPVPNEELRIVSGCAHPPDAPGAKSARCGVIVARVAPPEATSDSASASDAGVAANDAGVPKGVQILSTIDSGFQLSDVVLFGNPKLLRMWGIDTKGSFVREIGYGYGRVELGDPKRH